MNSPLLRAAVIKILKDREDDPAPDKYIMLALNVHYRIKPTFSELRSTMKDLDENGLLIGIHDDEVLVWGLSVKGKQKALSLS